MAHGFEAVFAPGTGSVDAFMEGLPEVLESSGLSLAGEAFKLERTADGRFNVAALVPEPIDDLDTLARRLRRWQGVGIGLISEELLKALGRCDAVEVDLRVCRSASGALAISYREARGSWRVRQATPALQHTLSGLLFDLAALGSSPQAIYDEETAELEADGVDAAIEQVFAMGHFPSQGRSGVLLLPAERARAVRGQLSIPGEQWLESAHGLVSIGFW
jgi:hypothetical protein